MANTRTSQLGQVTVPSDSDLVYCVDVSDTSMSAEGTSKQMTRAVARGIPRTDAESSASITPTDYTKPPGHILRYGTNSTPGTTDMAAALQAAVNSWNGAGGFVYLDDEDYLIESAITGAAGVKIVGSSNRDTRIIKGFNGDMFTSALALSFDNLQINGDGSNFTGRGVVVSHDDVVFRDVRITDMDGYCVECSGENGGNGMMIFGGVYNRTTVSDPAIKYPTDNAPTHRWLMGVNSGGGHLVDFGGCDNGYMIGCRTANLAFGTDSAKVMVIGCRIASADADIPVNGTSHVISDCVLAGDLVFDTDTTQCQARGNVFASGFDVVDNATDNSNSFDTKLVPYTPTWTASSSNPSLGNGVINASYQRNGGTVTVSIDLNMGSTTTFGTGDWSFSLPFQCNNDTTMEFIGSGYYLDSGTARVTGLATRIQSGASTVEILAGSTGFVGPTSPITWATNDELHLTFTYFA